MAALGMLLLFVLDDGEGGKLKGSTFCQSKINEKCNQTQQLIPEIDTAIYLLG
jgi:hypothetical protein